jgi:hypothetical protein
MLKIIYDHLDFLGLDKPASTIFGDGIFPSSTQIRANSVDKSRGKHRPESVRQMNDSRLLYGSEQNGVDVFKFRTHDGRIGQRKHAPR